MELWNSADGVPFTKRLFSFTLLSRELVSEISGWPSENPSPTWIIRNCFLRANSTALDALGMTASAPGTNPRIPFWKSRVSNAVFFGSSFMCLPLPAYLDDICGRQPTQFHEFQVCRALYAYTTASSGGASRHPQNGITNPKTSGTRIDAHIGTRATRRMMQGCSRNPSTATITA